MNERSGAGDSRVYNATMRKFGAPSTRIRDFEHWNVLLRPKQATLGAVIIAAYEPVEAFSRLSSEAFAELKRVTTELETALSAAFQYDKLNYLMLMMVDPHVHFHVVPRYATARTFLGLEYSDPGWPGPPELGHEQPTDEQLNRGIIEHIVANWP